MINITLNDIAGYQSKRVTYNDVNITRNDIISMPKLMNFLSSQGIYIPRDGEISLSGFSLPIQNEIALYYFDYYGYIIYYNSEMYLDKTKFYTLFNNDDIILGYFDRSQVLVQTPAGSLLDYRILTTAQLNDVVLNWFNKLARNYLSVDKNVPITTNLFDIDLSSNNFSKVTDAVNFFRTQFDRYLRMQSNSVPFSDGYGSSMKSYLQRKADGFTQQILVDEVNLFLNDLNSIYPDNFALIGLTYVEQTTIAVRIIITVTIQINNDAPITFTLQGQTG